MPIVTNENDIAPMPTPMPARPGGPPALFGNIAAGFRLAMFLRVRADMFRADTSQAVYALLAAVAALILYRFLAVLPNPELNVGGLANIAAGYLVFLFALWLIAALMRATDALSLLVVMLASAEITASAVIVIAFVATRFGFEGMDAWIAGWSVFAFGVLWQTLIALRAFKAAFGATFGRSLALSAVYLVFLLAPAFGLPNQPLWYEGHTPPILSEEDSVPQRPIDVERTFYAQQSMLEEAIAGIAPDRPDVADLYFIGFAGFGAQDVFMKEVRTAATLFDQRFDTLDRSLMLINNRATIDDVPLANNSNLRLALLGVAEKMNTQEDILFLFLTSHGSPNKLATSFWPLNHNTLTGEVLRAALDESGIRWRVIVVSACYSGSFIEPLKSEGTLVITASRKDRTSFGCSNEAEFTYFGKALIDEALRETRSFTEAFAKATRTVAAREETGKLEASEPQIFIGQEIQARLSVLESRLNRLDNVAARD